MKMQTAEKQELQHSITLSDTNKTNNDGTAQLADNRKTTTDQQALQQKMHANTKSITPRSR